MTERTAIEIGKRLRSLRRRKGLSQAVLAERSGISRASITNLERGRAGDVRAETLARLATALEVDLFALVSERKAEPAAGVIIPAALGKFALSQNLNYREVQFLAEIPFSDARQPSKVEEWEKIYIVLKPYM
ncbi:MAG: transcriptional regulator [Chloroflexi bacterium]|nr:transcriptional regulator [Chloroflexota bacterium]